MTKKKPHRHRRRPNAKGDVILAGPDHTPPGMAAARDADIAWFLANPNKTKRTRRAIPAELTHAGRPPDTIADMMVERTPAGFMVRALCRTPSGSN